MEHPNWIKSSRFRGFPLWFYVKFYGTNYVCIDRYYSVYLLDWLMVSTQ